MAIVCMVMMIRVIFAELIFCIMLLFYQNNNLMYIFNFEYV